MVFIIASLGKIKMAGSTDSGSSDLSIYEEDSQYETYSSDSDFNNADPQVQPQIDPPDYPEDFNSESESHYSSDSEETPDEETNVETEHSDFNNADPQVQPQIDPPDYPEDFNSEDGSANNPEVGTERVIDVPDRRWADGTKEGTSEESSEGSSEGSSEWSDESELSEDDINLRRIGNGDDDASTVDGGAIIPGLTLDPESLKTNVTDYMERYRDKTRSDAAYQANWQLMLALLNSDIGKEVMRATDDELYRYVISDVYKARMHKMYAKYYRAVRAKFALNVRKSPCVGSNTQPNPEGKIKDCVEGERGYWNDMKDHEESQIANIKEIIKDIYPHIKAYGDTPEELNTIMPLDKNDAKEVAIGKMLQESEMPLFDFDSNKMVWITHATGLIDASHSETNTMQLIQEHIIMEQAIKYFGARATIADIKAHLLGNSLAKLVESVTEINAVSPAKFIALFAGRRSSSRRFLFLQNLYCAMAMTMFIGTSATAVNQFIASNPTRQAAFATFRNTYCKNPNKQTDTDPKYRAGTTETGLVLIGTHAHEVQMVTQQLLGYLDPELSNNRHACVTNLAAHLVFVLTHAAKDETVGEVKPWHDIANVTALADTYGTPSFIAAASVALLPQTYIEMLPQHFQKYIETNHIQTVFDLIRVWRMDSGNYEANAKLILEVWRSRRQFNGVLAPQPRILHSYLESVKDVVKYSELPPVLEYETNFKDNRDIAPSALGFGSLLDGFKPFRIDDNAVVIGMSSLVMKAVQADVEGIENKYQTGWGTAGKASDESGKTQIDPLFEARYPGRVEATKYKFVHMRDGFLKLNNGQDGPIEDSIVYNNQGTRYYDTDPKGLNNYTYTYVPIDDEGDIMAVNDNFKVCLDLILGGFLNGTDVDIDVERVHPPPEYEEGEEGEVLPYSDDVNDGNYVDDSGVMDAPPDIIRRRPIGPEINRPDRAKHNHVTRVRYGRPIEPRWTGGRPHSARASRHHSGRSRSARPHSARPLAKRTESLIAVGLCFAATVFVGLMNAI